MPTTDQIADADPLTSEQAYRLKAKVRGSERYHAMQQLYADVGTKIDALVGVDSIASRHLSAIAAAIDLIGDGTVGVRGGRYGADYSQTRDREDLLNEVLDALYSDTSGSTVFYFGSTHLTNTPTW